MTIHKLNPDPSSEGQRPFTVGVSVQNKQWSIAQAIIKARAVQALGVAGGHYPIHRWVRCAVRRRVEEVFDELALLMGLVAQRLDSGELLLDGPGVFVHAWGARKSGYCSCTARVWADSKSRADEVRAAILRIVERGRIRDQMFVIDWQFSTGNGGSLNSASFEEIAHEQLHDEAYPTLAEPVMSFVRRYLEANETILILLGAPGSGKTRLARAILGEMSRRKGESAEVMYTCDKKTLENDEIFVQFITGSHDAFIVEDADHVLTPRANGNQDLHRFLAVADGVVRAQGRKIIFTTNLPNVGDLDEALMRPGRCFGTVNTRSLTAAEGEALVGRICEEAEGRRVAMATAFPPGVKSCSVAGIYRACAAAKPAAEAHA
jgi:energy-coupling factor transporter ATP-binding protein EcfA2